MPSAFHDSFLKKNVLFFSFFLFPFFLYKQVLFNGGNLDYKLLKTHFFLNYFYFILFLHRCMRFLKLKF